MQRLTDVYYNAGAPAPFAYPTGTSDVNYGYAVNSVDYGGNLKTHMRDASGDSYYSYDCQGRLVSYTPPVGLAANYYEWYNYNNAGQKTEVKITNGSLTPYDVVYDYYANGWLQDVKYNTNTIAQCSYDSAGNRTRISYPNGVSTSYAYDNDPRYRLIGITDSGGNMGTVQIGYTVDSVGNPLTMSDWVGTSSYGYDANNRLTNAAMPNPVPSQPGRRDLWLRLGRQPDSSASRAESDELQRGGSTNRLAGNARLSIRQRRESRDGHRSRHSELYLHSGGPAEPGDVQLVCRRRQPYAHQYVGC